MLDQNSRTIGNFVSERKKRRSSALKNVEDSVKRLSLSKVPDESVA